nr:hypothetical protein [Tanacetum cinerariifolium]
MHNEEGSVGSTLAMVTQDYALVFLNDYIHIRETHGYGIFRRVLLKMAIETTLFGEPVRAKLIKPYILSYLYCWDQKSSRSYWCSGINKWYQSHLEALVKKNYLSIQDLFKKKEAQPEITQNISSLKLPMLKTGDYDLWSMRMEQYLTHIDYALWEVIINGDSPVPEPPAVAIPDEHLLKFHSIKDANYLWEAIKISINETVNVAHDIPAAGSKEQHSASSYADDLVAMITIRVKKFMKRKGRNLNFNRKEPIGFDKTKFKCYNCHRRGHFAKECRAPRNQGNRSADNERRVVPVETSASALVVQDGLGLNDSVFKFKISESRTSINENESIASKSSEDIREEPKTVRVDWNGMKTQKQGIGFEFNKEACFICGSVNHLIKDCTFYENKMVEKSVVNNKGKSTGQREVRPVWNNARRMNHQKFSKMTHPHQKRNFVTTAVATKSGQVLVNAAKQHSTSSTSTARTKVNTAAVRPNVNAKSSYFKPHFPKKRHFNHRSAAKLILFQEKLILLKERMHMTCNKSFLTEYQEIDGGFVAFRGSPKGAGSESRPLMPNKENYVPWSSRLLRYAKSRPNGRLIHNSILNGPYVKKMIPEPGDANRDITVTETFHLQTDDEISDKELKQIEADDQAIQTILLGLPEDIYAAVDSCETAQEIWLRVQQMMKGSDIEIQEKNVKLFNECERFTSNEEESIESYYHRFLKLMNDLKRNKHFPEKIASNMKFLNNLQPEWSRHVTIVHQTKDLHTSDYTQLHDFLKYNQKERISSNPKNMQIAQPGMNIGQDRQMQMVGGNGGNQFRQYAGNPTGYNDVIGNQNQIGNGNLVAARAEGNATGQNGNQIRCYNCRGVGNPAGYNDVIGNQVIQNAVQNLRVQNVGNQNGLIGVQGNGNQNQIGNSNLMAARAEGNAAGQNGNQIRCYNCRGVGRYARNCTVKPRRKDVAYLQTQLLIAQKEEAGIQLQAKESIDSNDSYALTEARLVLQHKTENGFGLSKSFLSQASSKETTKSV